MDRRRRQGATGSPAAARPAAIELAAVPGARKGAIPGFVTPQLATLAAAPPTGSDWLHEIKFDGYRMLARLVSGRVQLLTRRDNDWTDKFPAIVAALAAMPIDAAFLDGEIVDLGESGASSFSALQEDLSENRSERLTYVVFDLLALDGYVLTACRLEDRKRLLQALLAAAPAAIRYSEHVAGDGPAFFARVRDAALEGIVSKRRDGPYIPGRSKSWLKIKCVGREEFVVLGWTEPAGARRYLGALLLGYYDADGILHYAGRVGTGFTERTLRELHELLAPLERPDTPLAERVKGIGHRVHWAEPVLVAEIRFAEWTRDRRLRVPAFLGLREDKTAREVVLDPRAGTALPPR